jgi:hypothetical protein
VGVKREKGEKIALRLCQMVCGNISSHRAFLDGLAKVVNIPPYSPFLLFTKIIGKAKRFFRYDTCAKNPNLP